MNIEAAKDQITNFKIISRAWFPYLFRTTPTQRSLTRE
jgi:hypothetical protein